MSAAERRAGSAPARAGRLMRHLGTVPALVVTLAVLTGAFAFGGSDALGVVAMLAVLEVSFSFDNAVLNATILRRMSPFWQRMFLTVGILVAVFGVRLLLPVAIVALTTGSSPAAVVSLALRNPHLYQQHLEDAHPVVAAMGGMFLLLIFLDFLTTRRTIHWVRPVERFASRLSDVPQLPAITALVVLLLIDLGANPPHGEAVLAAGMLGVVGFLLIRSLGDALERRLPGDEDDEAASAARPGDVATVTGKAAFVLFCYLEMADASFSFDGVIGAFAITSDIVLIMAGLGIGALYVRSLTVHLVRKGTLDEYVFLEHGAHYAIGSLAVLLLVTVHYQIPDAVIGLVGTLFIVAAVVSSLRARRTGTLSEAPLAVSSEPPQPGAAAPVDATFRPITAISATAAAHRLGASGAVADGGGVNGTAAQGAAVNTHGAAVNGTSVNGTGVSGTGINGTGVNVTSVNGTGVNGTGAGDAARPARSGLREVARETRRAGQGAPVIRFYVAVAGYEQVGGLNNPGVAYARRIAGPAELVTPPTGRVVYLDDANAADADGPDIDDLESVPSRGPAAGTH